VGIVCCGDGIFECEILHMDVFGNIDILSIWVGWNPVLHTLVCDMLVDKCFDQGWMWLSFRKITECSEQFRSQITKWLTIFVSNQISLLCIFRPPPGPSLGILRLIINRRGPN
jgi:hypothetical protein